MSSAVTTYQAPNLPSQGFAGNTGQLRDSHGNLLLVPLPTNGTLNTVTFEVHLAGYTTVTASRSITVAIGITGFGPLITSGSHAVTPAAPLFHLIGNCYWDGTTKIIAGQTAGWTGVTAATAGVITFSGIDPNQDSNGQSSAPLVLNAQITASTFTGNEQLFATIFEIRVV